MAREAIEFERLYMRERFRRTKSGEIRNGRVSAEIQEHTVASQGAYSAVSQPHLNGIWSDEATLAQDQFGPAFLVLVHMHTDEPIHHPPLAGSHLSNLNRCRRSAAAEFAVMADKVGNLSAVDHVLRRQAGDIRARSPDEAAFDDRCP